MEFIYEYKTEEERNLIINKNKEKYLISEKKILSGNYLVFTDIKPIIIPSLEEQINEITKEQGDKISILEAENEKLKVEQEQQNEEILVNMLANTEMFEMILGMMPMTLSIEDKNTKNSGGSSMIEVYCTLIIKGVKDIEDVPLVIREQVIERLKQLEVPVK